VIAFAPTCHGKLFQQSTETRIRRYSEIGQLAQRLRSPALIFLYEGDSYYELEDWNEFEANTKQRPQIRVVKLDKRAVLLFQRPPALCTSGTGTSAWSTIAPVAYLGSGRMSQMFTS
jgi:hypothetical protein